MTAEKLKCSIREIRIIRAIRVQDVQRTSYGVGQGDARGMHERQLVSV